MKKDLLLLLDVALGFVLSSALVFLAVAAIHLDINIASSAMSEESFMELMQEILLLLVAGSFIWMSIKKPDMRPAFVLIGGFFICMLLREMDYWFGLMGFHWLPPTVIAAALSISYAAKKPQQTIHGLARFAESQPFILIMTGLLTVLVFSRLFGMGVIWRGLLGEDYPRWVKIFAEEGTELFGYVQCFMGCAFYALQEWRKVRVQSEVTAVLPPSEATERMTS